jgi:hypothetical protein
MCVIDPPAVLATPACAASRNAICAWALHAIAKPMKTRKILPMLSILTGREN